MRRGHTIDSETVITKENLRYHLQRVPKNLRKRRDWRELPGEPVPAFTARDHKDLRRLLRKFGADRIITEMQTLRPRGPGRPHAEEDIDVAFSIEEWAEQHRQQGSCHPIRDAALDLYELKHTHDELRRIDRREAREREKAKASGKKPPPSHFDRWWENRYKKKYLRGRKEFRRQEKEAEEQYLRSLAYRSKQKSRAQKGR